MCSLTSTSPIEKVREMEEDCHQKNQLAGSQHHVKPVVDQEAEGLLVVEAASPLEAAVQ